MKIPMPQLLKKLWETWDLRSLIILSLSLQAFLIVFAPLRRRTRTYWITMPLWTAYLLADWVANFSVGQISSNQSNKFGGSKRGNDNADILAFWAPFLLVHLGGPDTITAFALEDNELWIRHLLGLIFQSGAAVYVFYLSLPKNQLWLPTVLMFISGTIKYGERTKSLYLASLNRFRDSILNLPDPGPNYARLMNEYRSKREANLPTSIEMIPEPARGTKSVNKVKTGKLKDIEVVLYAHKFFKTFKGLVVDLIFSLRDRNQTRDFFLKRTSADAFKVIEVELNLIYDVLFSKVSVVYTNFGYFFRFISFSLVVTSLGLFYCEDKSNFKDPDVAITYTLLLGAIALDVIAFIQLVNSVWLIVARKKLPDIEEEHTNEDSQESDAEKTSEKSCFGRIVQVLSRRWSESISGYNLISYCLYARKPEQEKLIDSLGLTVILDELKYVKKNPFTKELRDHIFKELKVKSEMADDLDTAKEISAARGDWTLKVKGCTDLLPYVNQVNYDESLLLWHVATELCHADESDAGESKNDVNHHRKFSKHLSDYMLYLLVMQPKMMSALAGIGQIRFRDTCAETKNFFANRRVKRPNGLKASLYAVSLFFKYLFWCPFLMLRPIIVLIISVFFHLILPFIYIIYLVKYCCGLREVHAANGIQEIAKKCRYSHIKECSFQKKRDLEKEQRDACRRILEVNTEANNGEVKPVTLKGDRSKSVLFDGCILAKKLKKLDKDKWEIISKVWVEMLSYAAIHCRANNHVQQLTKGGELVTIVWFLMAHFGLCDQFQINQGHTRAKLIVKK